MRSLASLAGFDFELPARGRYGGPGWAALMRTPLARVRGLGSAKGGTGDWIASRVTSVALVPLTLFFVVLIVALNGRPHAEVVEALSSPLVAVLLIATILVTIVHMRLGMQV